MVQMPQKKLLVEQKIENRLIPLSLSTYLGPSALGTKCARAIWYKIRNADEIYVSPRTMRLFGRGHREEPIVIQDLQDIGVEILTTQERKSYLSGHGLAFLDARIRNLPDAPKTEHLLEIKTANAKNFATIASKGIKASKPEYYIQAQVYMHLFGLTRCLFVVVNKNDDSRHYERIKYDKGYALDQIRRAEEIINAKTPPMREGDSENIMCNWCDYHEICHEGADMRVGCRTCAYVEPAAGGKWICRRKRKGKNLKRKKQLKGCKKYMAVSAV